MSGCNTADTFEEVAVSFRQRIKSSNIFPIHIRSDLLRTSLKLSERKRNIVRQFEEAVSGLRNSSGGYVLVHLCNKTNTSLNLEDFDETFEKSLKTLIGDGSPFVEEYNRALICRDTFFKEYIDVVVVTVKKTSSVSSVVENTKVCSDLSVERPSPLELYGYIWKRDVDQSHPPPKVRGIDPGVLQEERSIQLKTILPKDVSDLSSGVDWPLRFAIHIWKKLRFQEYLSCMSKVKDGGSYFLGVKQERTKQKLSIDGFYLAENNRGHLSEALKGLLKEIVILKPNGSFESGIDEVNLIRITYHPVVSGNVVLEISVRGVSGIVFYEHGPKAYKCEQSKDGTHRVVEMSRLEWLERFKQLGKRFQKKT